MSFQMKVINAFMRYTVKPILTYTPFSNAILSPTKLAVDFITHLGIRPRSDYEWTKVSGDLYGEWVDYHDIQHIPDSNVVLYLHGGGYLVGSPGTHRTITTALSKHANCTVFALDYRKAPEHKYPSALEDAVTAYKWLLHKGYKNISIAGDSAGGNLTLEVTREILDRGIRSPNSICAISPWCALYSRKEYYTDNANDPMLPGARIQEAGELYSGKFDVRAGNLSPIHMNFEDFPPSMFTVGSKELLNKSIKETYQYLLDDTEEGQFHHLFKEYDGCPHVFQLFYGIAPEAKDGIIDIAKFFREHWN